MNTNKRGDHLFATGLSKTIGDIAAVIDAQIGDCSEGRVLHAALSRCSRLLTGGVFDAVIDKGRPMLQADEHSAAFGQHVLDLKLQMQSLVFALRFRRDIDDTDSAARGAALRLANGQLATAKHYAMLAVGNFFDTAVDEAVASRLTATSLRGEIEAARASLDRVRQSITICIGKM